MEGLIKLNVRIMDILKWFKKENNEKTGNQVHTLHVYKYNDIYVFDKPEWDTEKEAFVGGATEYLERITQKAKSFTLIFSADPMPDAHRVDLLSWSKEGGSYYFSEKYCHQLWLCPYLLKYYKQPPKKIYLIVNNFEY